MTKPLYPSSIFLFSVLYLQAPAAINGWMPRPRFTTSCNGVRIKNSGGGSGRDASRQQKVSLSASGDAKDDHRKANDEPHLPSDEDTLLPLFAEEGRKDQLFQLDISRLEAIFDMDSGLFNLDDKSSGESQRLLSGERVILRDLMSWDEGKCSGDFCGDEFDQCDIPDEYKIVSPTIDVMSFLGIRRAVPVQVSRDWD
jgi:hypothetical protein